MKYNLKEVIAYILQRYPYDGDLSNARLTKLIYLSDWHQAIHYKKQITPIEWYFDNFGPFVPDVQNAAMHEPSLFKIIDSCNMYGKPKRTFKLLKSDYNPVLGFEAKASIDYVISVTKDLPWDAFIKLVYSTYPVMSSDKYSLLNLEKKAAKYRILIAESILP